MKTKGYWKTLSMMLCIAMVFSIAFGGIRIPVAQAAEVTQNPGESWNSYLDRVYQARYAEFLTLRAKNADNNVPEDQVWTGNAVQPAGDADGDGLLDIYTAAEFRWALTNKRSCELMNDIDLGGRKNVTWTPVADPGAVTIEGNGYTVYNMNCSAGQYGGLIASTARGALGAYSFKMQNIRFRYCYTRATGQYSGTVIGFMGNGIMKQVSVEDSVVWGAAHTGGIMSAWSGTGDPALNSFYVEMDQCHVRNITVYGTSCVGSFVGPASGTKVTNCYSIDSYDISTATHSGGFISCPGYCRVENCFTNVRLYCNADGGVFAGICHLSNSFKNCFSAGVVEGTSNVGGFFGRSENSTDTFVNCYSTSMVGMQSSASGMGGFYGGDSNNTARGTNCYCAGEVGTTQTVAPHSSIGGFGGTNVSAGRFNNCYYDKQTSGMGEYAIATTPHTSYAGISGYLTGQMIGDGMKDEFGSADWVYRDGMYPQLAVFANVSESFGNETDRMIAKAYSAASVCTALLQPSNLGKTQEELEEYGPADYDKVRDISVLFPLTNNELAGYGPGSGFSISWRVRDGYTCNLPGSMNGLPVITIDPKTYEVTNFAPGVGWVDVSVDTGIVNPQNGQNIVGQRFMRLVPTTVISLASSAGVDKVIYVANDERLSKDDISYDHRENVIFAAGKSQDVDTGAIKTAGYPEDDTSFGYRGAGEDKEVVGVDLANDVGGGKAVVVVSKLNPETGKYEELDITSEDELKELLLRERDAAIDDIGVYLLEYRWYTSGNLKGGYITNSKTLTVRYALKVSYDWNHPSHKDDSVIQADDYPYTIGSTVNGTGNKTPEDPSVKGYTFMGWSTDPKADPNKFERFTADTPLKDDTVAYAVWKINSYDVSIVKNGRGTISGTGAYDYGSSAKVTWQPEEGWYTNYVMVDGVIRDDLLNKNEYTFKGIEEDHTVYVEFGQDKRVDTSEYYQVTTTRTGGDDSCKISNSVSVKAGESATVTWSAGEGYVVKKVLIDGILAATDQKGSYTFHGMGRNHDVEVVFEKAEDKGTIHVTEEYSTVTTSKRGNGTVLTPSASVKNTDSHTVKWQPDPGHKVAKIIVDGQEITEESILKSGQYTFSPVDHDRTIEVVFEADPDSPDYPGPVDPDVEKTTFTVETLITGGPGTITPGAAIEVVTNEGKPEAGTDYKVEWDTPDKRYKVKDIYVDGVSVKDNPSVSSEVEFKDIDSDHKVLVVMEPNLFQVKTIIEGEGKITPGATLFWGENYGVSYEPADGWELKQIYRDGVAQIEEPDPEPEASPEASSQSNDEPEPEEPVTLSALAAFASWPARMNGLMTLADDPTNGKMDFNAIEQDHTVKVVFAKTDAPDDDTAIKHTVTTSLNGGVGSVTPGAVLEDGSSYTVEWEIGDGYELDTAIIRVNGVEREAAVNGNKIVIDSLNDDVEVVVSLRPTKTVSGPGATPDGDDAPKHNIYTSIEKGAGTITSSMNGVAQGSDQTVYWTFGNDSAIRTIYVDGVVRDDLLKAGKYTFKNIDKDHRIDIYIKEDPNGTGGVVDKESYRISTAQSGQGEISNSTTVNKGENTKVSWKPANGYQVNKVFIDGVERPDLASANEVIFNSVGADHNVYVDFTKIGSTGDTPSSQKYRVDTAIQGDGTISPSATLEKGESKTVSWSPKNGSVVAAVIVDGIVRDDLLNASSYSFNNIDSDHSVEVLFKKPDSGEQTPDSSESGEKYIHIKTATSGQGSISASKTMKAGESYVVTWAPANGWKVAGVMLDGMNIESLASADQMSFNAPTADHTIRVIFVPADGSAPGKAYKVETELVGGEGMITSSGEALEGGSYTISWKPNVGYQVASIIVDGVERPDLLNAGSLTLSSIHEEHSIRVVLKKAAGGNGGGMVKTGDGTPPVMALAMFVMMTAVAIALGIGKRERKVYRHAK